MTYIFKSDYKIITLNEINDLTDKIILLDIIHSSGLGGLGGLFVYLSDGRYCYIGFGGLPCSEYKLGELIPILERARDKGSDFIYAAQKEGFKLINGKYLVRNEYSDKFKELYEIEKKKNMFIDMNSVVEQLLDCNLHQYILKETYEYYEKIKEVENELRLKREMNKLVSDDLTWLDLYPNNNHNYFKTGEYTLLFKQVGNNIRGYKYSIVYQFGEDNKRGIYPDVVNRYNIFEKEYDSIIGPLYYNGENECLINELENTFSNANINDYGRFMISYSSLRAAKEFVLDEINLLRIADKTNIVTDIHNKKREYESMIRRCTSIINYYKYSHIILDIIKSYEFMDSSFGGGYIIDEIVRQTGLSANDVKEMCDYSFLVLTPMIQRIAHEKLNEYQLKLDSLTEE